MGDYYDVIVCGTCFADMIFGELSHLPQPGEEVFGQAFNFTGGGAYITAVAAARLGLKVAIVSPFGDGVLEKMIRDGLNEEGVDTRWSYDLNGPLPFVTVAVNYGGDRGFITYAPPFDGRKFVHHVLEVLDRISAQWIHMGAHRGMEDIIDTAKRRRMNVSMDVGWDKEWLTDPALRRLISNADLFSPNRGEALAITGASNIGDAIETLHQWARRVIVTDGSKGCMVKDEGTDARWFPAEPVTAVDSTGAGDNFVAGVLAGLVNGASLADSIRLGSFCGKESVKALGGSTNSPTIHAANEFLQPYGWRLLPWERRLNA